MPNGRSKQPRSVGLVVCACVYVLPFCWPEPGGGPPPVSCASRTVAELFSRKNVSLPFLDSAHSIAYILQLDCPASVKHVIKPTGKAIGLAPILCMNFQ